MKKILFGVVITVFILSIIALVLGYYAFWGYLAWQWTQPHSFLGFVWFFLVWSVLNYAATYLIRQILGILRKRIPALDAALARREKGKMQKSVNSNAIYDDFDRFKKQTEPPKIIHLSDLQRAVAGIADIISRNRPSLYLDYAGIRPADDSHRYTSTPTNVKVFGSTGGDGVHYSLLEISDTIQPVVVTVPCNYGDTPAHYNIILGENLNEFLSLGYYNGWFPLEQLCYDKSWAIDFYATESIREESGDTLFIKALRETLGYPHIPLNLERIDELQRLYFDKLQFDPEFTKRFDSSPKGSA
jgi:hypothetical protein